MYILIINNNTMFNKIKVFLWVISIFIASYSSLLAAWLNNFEVIISPNTANIWESLDMTIKAVDKNWKIVTNYTWQVILFSDTDPEVELPSSLEAENTYTFKWSDQWYIKFENAVKFKASGNQSIHIYDLDDDTVLWIGEVVINKSNIAVNEDILINSPENNITIWDNFVTITWTTNKNHNINIIVNNGETIKTLSNWDGIFEKYIDNLKTWENIFKAQILDSENNIIGESDDIKIKIETSELLIKNIKIIPNELEVNNAFEVELIANSWLQNASVIINNVITKLEENKAWVYIWKINAPNKAWVYKVDAKITDDLWHTKQGIEITSINVLAAKIEEVIEIPLEVAETVVVEENTGTWEVQDKMEITWLKLIELKTKSILTWDNIESAKSYNIYKKSDNWDLELVDNVTTPKYIIEIKWDTITFDYFAIKALSETWSGNIYEWDLSEATKIKTWPELIILLILTLIIWSMFVFINKRSS